MAVFFHIFPDFIEFIKQIGNLQEQFWKSPSIFRAGGRVFVYLVKGAIYELRVVCDLGRGQLLPTRWDCAF